MSFRVMEDAPDDMFRFWPLPCLFPFMCQLLTICTGEFPRMSIEGEAMDDVVIAGACRSPIGGFLGSGQDEVSFARFSTN